MKRSIKGTCIALSFCTALLVAGVAAAADGQATPATDQAEATTTADLSPAAVQPGATVPPAAGQAVPPVDTTPAPSTAQPDPTAPALQLSPPISRIGVVDISRIDRESKQGKAAEAKVKARKEKLQAQLTAKQKQIEKRKAEIEAQLPTLSPEQRAKTAKDFEKKVDEYRKLLQKAENDMKPLVEELARTLTRDAKAAAAAYGKENGLAAVVSSRELLYVGSSTFPEDVTDGVLQQMNEIGSKP